ncbi:MAG: DUF3592 domain-containing protein [Planctomycetota bacterium]
MTERRVPRTALARILFSGFISYFGWAFFGIGMIFFWLFVVPCEIWTIARFAGDLETAEGTVLFSEFTKVMENERTVHAIHYTFEVDSKPYQGTSYQARSSKDGTSVTVEFPKGSPGSSRIQGMRAAPNSWPFVFAGIFPFAGFFMVFFRLRRGLRAWKLLRSGEQGVAVLAEKKSKDMEINGQRVYEISFLFDTPQGANQVVKATTHRAERLEDDEEEVVLYMADDPSYAMLLDDMPGAPSIDDHGYVRPGRMLPAVTGLAVPVFVVGAQCLYWILRLSR